LASNRVNGRIATITLLLAFTVSSGLVVVALVRPVKAASAFGAVYFFIPFKLISKSF
jgi:hypothetical protein